MHAGLASTIALPIKLSSKEKSLQEKSCKPFLKFGAPGAIRTPDPLVRSQILYPTELRARCLAKVLFYHN